MILCKEMENKEIGLYKFDRRFIKNGLGIICNSENLNGW